MLLSKLTSGPISTLVAVPTITAVIFVLVLGEWYGARLAAIFGIDVNAAIVGQPGSEIYMMILMSGIVVLILA